MWKKLLCFILVCTMSFGSAVYAAPASDYQYSFEELMPIRVLAENGLVHIENALEEDDIWYFSTDFFSEHTDYVYEKVDDYTGRFVLDEEAGKTYKTSAVIPFHKTVIIDIRNKAVMLKGKGTALEGLHVIDGTVYLPGHQILPYLDALFMVQDNTLIVQKADASYAKLLNGFLLSDYMFDADREFGKDVLPSDLWKTISTSAAYLFDSLANIRLDRALFWASGNYDDYKDIYTAYVTDQDGYNYYSSEGRYQQKILEQENKIVGRYLKVLKKGIMKPFYVNLCDMFSRLGTESQTIGKALKFIKTVIPEKIYDKFDDAYYEIYVDYDDVKGGIKLAGYGLSMINAGMDYCMNMAAVVDDNLKALSVVYPKIGGNPAATEFQTKAIKKVYETYIDSVNADTAVQVMKDSFVNTLRDEIMEEGTAMLLGEESLGPVKFAAWMAGEVAPAVIKFIAEKVFKTDVGFGAIDDLALMNYHLGALEDAKDAYERYAKSIDTDGSYTQENLEGLRLSAILALLVSKKCYETMRDNASDLNKDYKSSCNYRIENIEKKLADLYEAGACVIADGTEYFPAAAEVMMKQLEPLKTVDDRIEKAFAAYLSTNGYLVKNICVFLDDMIGKDGVPEMAVADYSENPFSLSFFRYSNGEVKEIVGSILMEPEGDSNVAKCAVLTDDKDGNPGILELVLKDARLTGRSSLDGFSIQNASWYFSVLTDKGLEEKKHGDWKYSKSGKFFEESFADYAYNPITVMRNWDDDANILLKEAGSVLLTDNNLTPEFWFGYLGEDFFTRHNSHDTSLTGNLFEFSALVQTLGMYLESSYLITDADQDGEQELIMNSFDALEGISMVLTVDLNNGGIVGRSSGSAAGGLSFAEHTTDGLTLLKEYYYSMMTGTCAYYEWDGTEWVRQAFLDQITEEDASGNWVTKGSANWWGEEMTPDEFRVKEGEEIADILHGYDPDLSCIQIQGDPGEYSNELYLYLREERLEKFGLTEGDPIVAYNFGDIDEDGYVEDIFVVLRPVDPILDIFQTQDEVKNYLPAEEDCSFIIVCDKIDNTTWQMTTSYHWDDFDGEIYDQDIEVKDGVLYIKDESFAYNGTYIANMDLIG